MAYTNGIFRINQQTGSDAARTALTSCIASNPSGTITRINKTGHGLVTGAVVDLTLFSAWLNGAWKITVVDANNFDLDTAVWQTTADTNGTVTPRGGSSWSDAWLTITSGATAARIQPGDEIRINETPETSTGVDATFTNNNRTVTLSAPLTKTVQNCDGSAGWTAMPDITLGNNAQRKIGSNSLQITPGAAFTTGKMCFALIAGGGTQDFSPYTKISFFIRPNATGAIAANTYRICLCSDISGDTIVDAFNVPAILASTTSFHTYSVSKAGGGSLGSNIQSVAIYALADPGVSVITFNNIVACNDFDHNTIFGPQGDCKYIVQSIDGTTLSVDQAATAGTIGQGWSGTTGTYTLYQKKPVPVYNTGTWNTVSESGDQSFKTKFIGGWDTTSDTRVGETCLLSGIQGTGVAINAQSYNYFEYFGFYKLAANGLATTNGCTVKNCTFSNCATITISNGTYFTNCFFTSSSANDTLTDGTNSPVLVDSCIFANNLTGFGMNRPSVLRYCEFRNNNQKSVALYLQAGVLDSVYAKMYKCLLSDTTEVTTTTLATGIIWSYDHDRTPGNHWGFTQQGTVNWQTSIKQGSDPGSWRVVHSGSQRGIDFPIRIKVAEVACAASGLVTVTAWVKKDHATNVGCRVFVEDEYFTLSGIVADVETAASNTNWQQLTLTFTPTVNGIVPIWFESYYISGNSNTYLGSITATQV